MMTKEEYRKELIRMFDSLRKDHKGETSCEGVECRDCPLYVAENGCRSLLSTVEVYNAVEKWSKEHPQKYKISPFEYEYLKLYQKYGFGSDRLCDLRGTTILHELFYLKDIDLNVKVEDILLNCEVTEDVR